MDTAADIFLNGQKIASSEDMFLRLRVEVKPFLQEGENTIAVAITAPQTYIDRISETFTYHPPRREGNGSFFLRPKLHPQNSVSGRLGLGRLTGPERHLRRNLSGKLLRCPAE